MLMSKYAQGQMVALKSEKSITGAIVSITEGYPETRYQVFTATGLQTYYESQLRGDTGRTSEGGCRTLPRRTHRFSDPQSNDLFVVFFEYSENRFYSASVPAGDEVHSL